MMHIINLYKKLSCLCGFKKRPNKMRCIAHLIACSSYSGSEACEINFIDQLVIILSICNCWIMKRNVWSVSSVVTFLSVREVWCSISGSVKWDTKPIHMYNLSGLTR